MPGTPWSQWLLSCICLLRTALRWPMSRQRGTRSQPPPRHTPHTGQQLQRRTYPHRTAFQRSLLNPLHTRSQRRQYSRCTPMHLMMKRICRQHKGRP